MNWNAPELRVLIRRALAEDVGHGDATVQATVPAKATAHARLFAKAPLVCAGLLLVQLVFAELDAGIQVEILAKDGDVAEAGLDLLRIRGNAGAILSGERTALNFLTHLCGVATLTRRFVEQLAGTRAKIRDTRKTTPGFRALEKYAVRMGGGANHRVGLYDAILLKENHIELAGGVKAALDQAHAYASSHARPSAMSAYESGERAEATAAVLSIQIEVRNESELRDALEAGAEAVLLDNMPPQMARQAVALARRLRKDCVIEISGGITLANAREYALTGADYLSSGALTHSAPAADLSLLVENLKEAAQ